MKIYKIAFILTLLSINYAVYSQCGGVATFTDSRDGQIYNMIQIDGSVSSHCLSGSQCWMAENLNIGTMINGINTQADNGVIEKYCYGDDANNCNTYGGLYQWDEMVGHGASNNTNGPGPSGICPLGWHVPTENEWQCMEINLGMTEAQADVTGYRGTDQGTQIKQGGTSGFEALLGGVRITGGTFSSIGSLGYFWNASDGPAHRRLLFPSDGRIEKSGDPKTGGYSVRCIRDNAPWPLPIQLLYFEAEWTNNSYETATLNWETISEVENSHFEVERSIDGINFEFIKSVDGSGNSNQNISYTILDENPYTEGTSYYRLKQVDNNGDFEYSNIEALNIPEGLNMINLYPNPTVDQITVLFTSSEDTESTISIKNNLGQEVRQFNNKISKGYNSMNFSFSELSTGNYTIQISTASGLYKVEQKFIKTNQ